jgi:predicted nucleic acid-binding protein
MKYVVDASVGFKWLVVEQDTVKARRLRDDYHKGALELVAPDVFPREVINAVTKAERQQRITQHEGSLLVRDFLTALPDLRQTLPLLPRAYEQSSKERVAVYDCLYIALAEREQCKVVTADQRTVAVFPTQVVSLDSFPRGFRVFVARDWEKKGCRHSTYIAPIDRFSICPTRIRGADFLAHL